MKRITLMFFMFFLSMASFAQGLPPEGFESAWTASGPVGWGVYQNEFGTTEKWKQSNPDPLANQPAHSGTYAAYINRSNVPVGQLAKDWLVSPAFTLPLNPQLRFWSRLTLPANDGGTYKILIAPAGSDLTSLGSYTTVVTWTEPQINPDQLTYTEKIVDLPTNLPAGPVVIAFLMEGDDADRWLVDDVQVVQNCLTPVLQPTTAIGANGATLNWPNPQGTTKWEIEIVENTAAFTGVGTPYDGVPPYPAAGLNPLTAYKFKVRAVCSTTNKSAWSDAGTFTTLAAPPANDNCESATSLTVSSNNICTGSVAGTVRGATHSPQANGCASPAGSDDDDVWYQFVATSTTHTITLSNVAGSATDMYFVVYSGTDCNALTQVLCSDPNAQTLTGLTVGQTYKVRVYTWSTTAQTSTFNICVTTPVTSQSNDECANATVVPVNPDLLCGQTVAASVMGSTASPEANTCAGTDDDDVWFEFTATSAMHTISLDNRQGSVTDLVHVLYSGGCGALTQMYCSDPESSIATGLVPGQTYKIRVYTYSSTGNQNTTFTLCIGTPPPPPANDNCATPTVAPVNADLLCAQTVPGTVGWATASPEGGTTCTGTEDDDVWFEFTATNPVHTINLNNVTGTDTNLNHVLYSGACGSLTQLYCSDPNSSLASGLTVGQTYKVRVYSNGTTVGLNTTFNLCIGTPPPPPANDECTTATVVPVNPDLLCAQTVPGTVAWATHSTQGNTCNTGRDDDDVWFEFTATSPVHTITLSNVVGSDTDLFHVLYSGNQCGTLTQMYCSDPNTSTASGLTVGQTYKIRIYTWSTTSGQTTTFNVCVGTPPPPPANDECANAIVAVVNPTLACTQVTPGTIAWATPSAEGNTCAGTDDDDVWFEFTATYPIHTINLTNIAGSTTDLMHVVYSGNQCGSLTQLYCSDPESSIATNLVPGQTYKIRVYSYTGTAGQTSTFNLCIGTPPPPPANDECTAAVTVPVNPDLNCGQVTPGNVLWATPSSQTNTCGNTNDDDDVWFQFTATNPIHVISLTNVTGSATDLYHVVYSGDQCGALTQMYCSDNNLSVGNTFVVGQTYKIRVYTNTATPGQTTTFNVCVGTPPPPPANDECANAIVAPVNTTNFCIDTIEGVLTSATASAEGNTCNGTDDDDIWFEFTATSTSHYIKLMNITGSVTDLMHVVYEGDQCGTLVQKYCSDPENSTATGLTIGQTYKVRVYTYTANPLQNVRFDLCISTPATSQPNDDCANAIVAPVNEDSLCMQTTLGSVQGATASSQPYACAGTADDDVWFEFTATHTQHYIALLEESGNRLSTDALNHAVYTGDCGALTQIACSDPNNSLLNNLVVGQTYKIRIYSSANTQQPFIFRLCIGVMLTCAEAQPFCANNDVTGVTFPGSVGVPSLGDISCLNTTPNPTFYFLQIGQSGDLSLNISQTSSLGQPIDVDFIAYGPFTDITVACTDLFNANEIDCSYSAAAVEPFSIPGAVAGEYYMVMITNFNGARGTINFSQLNINDPDAGATDCSIVCTADLGDDQILCGSANNQYLLDSGIINATTYVWLHDGDVIPGANSQTYMATESGTYTVEITKAACDSNPTDEVNITFLPVIDIADQDVDLCGDNGESQIDLTTLTAGILGTLTPADFVVTYHLTEADALAGINPIDTAAPFDTTSQTIYVRVENATIADCFDVAPIVITVNTTADATIAYAGSPYCSNATNATVTLTGTAGGVYTATTGLVINTVTGTIDVAASEPGIYTVTYTVAATPTCDEFITTAEVIIVEAPEATIAYANTPYCATGTAAVTLTGTTGGTYSSTTGLVINTTTGVIDLAASTPGTYTVTYTVIAIAPCDELIVSTEIVINELPTATITYAGPYCADGGIATVTQTGETGGTYSSTEELVINTTTGDIDLAASIPGDYVVTYTIAAANGCPSIPFTTTVTITAKPEADFAYSSGAFCLNGGNAAPIFTGTATVGTFTVQPSTGLTIDSAGNITPATSTPGTYSITNTVDPVGTCAGDTATVIIVIHDAPIATFAYPDAEYCENGTSNPLPVLDDVVGNFSATPAGLAINTATGEIDLANSTPGTYTVSNTVSGTADCPSVTETTIVTIVETASVSVDQECFENNYTLTAVFNDTTFNEENVTFVWTDASGIELGNTSTLVIDEKGIYYLTVTPLNTIDCPIVVEVPVESAACLIQKGISPNGDGMNDNFDLSAFNVAKLSIFNRYGREVYSRTNYVDEWYGQQTNGNELPTGTYYFMIERKNGQNKTGWIYINRQE